MNNRQRAKLDSYERVATFNSKYAVELDTVTEYAAELLILNNNLNAIQSAATVQQQSSVPDSDTAISSKNKLALSISQFTLRGMVKARQLEHLTLAEQLDKPLTYITAATKTEAVHRANSLRNLLNDNKDILGNITDADIATMDASITEYSQLKNQPIDTRQTKKAEGTDILPAAFEAADGAIANMYALVRSYFFRSKPEMVDELSLAMEIIDTGIRHTSVSVLILGDETGEPILESSLTDTSNNHAYTADENGVVYIESHRNGHFNFTITAAGRQTVSLGADIKRGTLNSFTVRLKLS